MTLATPTPFGDSLHGRCIAVVGMNGVGKTNFGKRLAAKLGWKRADADHEFEKKHGDIHAFIERHGWDTYRKLEEEIVLKDLVPGCVTVLSGGAIESPAIRAALREHAIVIWIQASAKRLHKNLRRAKLPRPEFKDGLHRKAVDAMAETRHPHYEEAANIVIPPSVRFGGQIPFALKELEKVR